MSQADSLRVARALVLVSTAGVIAKVFLTGQMPLYMSPSMNPLTALAACVLAAMGLAELRATVVGQGTGRPATGFPHLGGHEAPVEQSLTLLVVVVPLVLGLVLAPRALGTAALNGEDITALVWSFAADGAAVPGSQGTAAPPAPRAAIEDFPDLYGYLRRAGAAGIGQRVHAVGVVARGAALGADQFVLLRYSLVHCVADARPVALVVRSPEAGRWRLDEWVEVGGSLAAVPLGSEQLVGILADRVAAIAEPPDPYLPPLL